MATVNVTLTLNSSDLFAKQNISFTETDVLSPAGDSKILGRLYTTGSGTKDALTLDNKALDGTNDASYIFLHNTSSTTGEYIQVGLRAAVGTASTGDDWFAVLGPGEFMFMPISDMQGIDVEPATGNPTVEFLLFDKAA